MTLTSKHWAFGKHMTDVLNFNVIKPIWNRQIDPLVQYNGHGRIVYNLPYMPSNSFFAHYISRFMHLWWLLIIIWISHDILRAVSYFLYHYYFINLQIACKGMLTNTAKHWLPFLAMNLENFKKYLQVCYQNI